MAFGRLGRRSAALVISAVLAACTSGGSSPSSTGSVSPSSPGSTVSSLTPAQFMDTLCVSETGWMNTIQILTKKMTDDAAAADSSRSDTAKRKRILVAYLDVVVSETEQLILEAQAIGAPDVDNGAAVQVQLVDAFTKVRDAFSTAQQKIKALSSEASAAITEAVNKAAQRLKTEAEDIASSMSGLDSKELKDAYKADAACSALRRA